MSSSFIIEPTEGGSKKDGTLILMINDNGIISVDQDTLQNLIINQSNATVNVVRLSQADNDAAEGNITLTVDPPFFSTSTSSTTGDSSNLVDPFMEMDSEQLERLETALQSEEAKQILGENVTAMLDMLTIEEQQNSIRYNIELDHCYTSRLSFNRLKSTDSLPEISSSDMEESMCTDINKSLVFTSVSLPVSSINHSLSTITSMKQKLTFIPPKITRPVSMSSRPRRASHAMQQAKAISKTSNNVNPCIIKKGSIAKEETGIEDELFSSSQSSESNGTDSDSDFGPRSFKRGVRARGGRRGLTMRGGSMAAIRRRSSNKQMDSEQVQRLDMEMAAALNAMKSPKKEVKSEKHFRKKYKKPVKILNAKKKYATPVKTILVDESLSPLPVVDSNILQTTNQVKANIINANMLKSDMVLTKPGLDLMNQKVLLIQKQIAKNPNELVKTISFKKQVTIPKNRFIISQNPNVSITKDEKVLTSKDNPGNSQQVQNNIHQVLTPIEVKTDPPDLKQSEKTVLPISMKITSMEVRREKKKSEPSDTIIKTTDEIPKFVESKTILGNNDNGNSNSNCNSSSYAPRKSTKKENRKSDSHIVQSLGPALFSTPDIIRRIGSTCDAKISNSPVTSTSTVIDSTSLSSSISKNLQLTSVSKNSDKSIDKKISTTDTVNESIISGLDKNHTLLVSETSDENKINNEVTISDLLPSDLDSVSNSILSREMCQQMKQSDISKNVIFENMIESDEHLLVTLEMETAKQLPNDAELLAEALLLQETLGVDLDNSTLVDPVSEVSDSLLSSTIMETEPSATTPAVETDILSMISDKKLLASSVSKTSSFSERLLTDAKSTSPISEHESGIKKAFKPVQIIRGGRVITLPPIEAPATRSKRLHTKTITQPNIQKLNVEPCIVNSNRSSKAIISSKKQNMVHELENDDQEDEANSDSEDDPNRLWCICRQPHNNRFMICCDICQDWFHGKCVHVTKAMGEQMEVQGIEWVCPNCSKKKNEECKVASIIPKKQRSESEGKYYDANKFLTKNHSQPIKNIKILSNSEKNPNTLEEVTCCVVCKKKARKSSIFCSDTCILAHAEVTSIKDKPSFIQQIESSKTDTSKIKANARIIVFDKKTGKVLTGKNAPVAASLKSWLKDHPTYDIVKSNNLNTIQVEGKILTSIQTEGFISNSMPSTSTNQDEVVDLNKDDSTQIELTSNPKKIALRIDKQAASTIPPLQNTLKQAKILTVYKTTSAKCTTKNSTLQPKQTSQKASKEICMKKCQDKTTSISQQKIPQQLQSQVFFSKKSEPEPIRLNVRKTLTELLSLRLKETNDLILNQDKILELALQIELEMYKFFKDTGTKYRAKYRSLVFNIKDTKNLTLFRKIADGSLAPAAVVKLSPDEMASQELAEWREKENKHQLEMIKKNELDLMAQAKSIVVKTHKGEQIIENDEVVDLIDLKTPVQDIVTVLNSEKKVTSTIEKSDKKFEKRASKEESKKKYREKPRGRHKRRDRSCDKNNSRRHSKDREHSGDKKSKKENKHKTKSKDRVKNKVSEKKNGDKKKKNKEKDKRDKHRHRSASKSRSKGHKKREGRVKKDNDQKKDLTMMLEVKPIEDRLWRHIEDETTNTLDYNDSDISDREPSSTVIIKTPDINDELEKDTVDLKTNETSTTIWRGFVHMPDVAKFFVTAQNVSGNARELLENLPDTLDVVGRISPSTVWEYINKMKKNANKEILIIKLLATNDEEKIPYITLYSYLNSRNRLGVLSITFPSYIKDFYIMPFSNISKLPSVLLPLDTFNLEENRQHLLLGIIVVHSRKKRMASGPPLVVPVPIKICKKEALTGDSSFMTPKTSIQEIKQNDSISKIVPELSSKIALESSSSLETMQLNDDDVPYSPGEPVHMVLNDSEETLKSSLQLKVKDVSSLELQRKMDELSKRIEEEKQQIQNMSSSFLGEISTTSPGLACKSLKTINHEAYSSSNTDIRSFTPPPLEVSNFSQPILDKVSGITIPANLQEILANVKRQENFKVDSYLPPKPGATFLTTINSTLHKDTEVHKDIENYTKSTSKHVPKSEIQLSPRKEIKSTLSSLSDYDLMKKAEEELAAIAAADAAVASVSNINLPSLQLTISSNCSRSRKTEDSTDTMHR